MDPLTLCLKRQRTGYATAPGYPWQASDYPLPVLFIFHPAHSPGLCLWGMRVVLLVRGWNPSWHFAWPWTGAVKGSNSIFLFSHFPLSHFLLCSALFLLHLRNYVPYISLLVHKEYINFSAAVCGLEGLESVCSSGNYLVAKFVDHPMTFVWPFCGHEWQIGLCLLHGNCPKMSVWLLIAKLLSC